MSAEEKNEIIETSAEEKKDKVWGTVNYIGSKTQAAACFGCLLACCGCFFLLCPMVRTTIIRIV
jgi:hypothetical protein